MGKLGDIPARVKPPCKAAQAMLDHLEADDFDALAAELATGMKMSVAWQWVEPVIGGDLSSSSWNNHLMGRCGCPDDSPLLGVCRG